MSDKPKSMLGETVLMTVKLAKSKPSVADAAASLGVPVESIDAQFGVVPIDPDHGLYSVKIPHDAAPAAQSDANYHGPYSNPRIAPFGPPKRKTR